MANKDISTNAEINSVRLKEQVSAPATPDSGYSQVYVKSDGLLYYKDDGGVEHGVISGSATVTDGNLVVFNGTGGNKIKDGGAIPSIDIESELATLLTTPGDILIVSGAYGTREDKALQANGGVAANYSTRGDFPQTNINDSNDSSNWASSGGGVGNTFGQMWIGINLNASYLIDAIRLKQAEYLENATTSSNYYSIQTSDDGTNYTELQKRTIESTTETYYLDTPKQARYWRIVPITGGGGFWWVGSFELWGKSVGTPEITRLPVGQDNQVIKSVLSIPKWENNTLLSLKDVTSASVQIGNMLIYSGSSWNFLPIGSASSVLKVVNGLPAWVAP
jgi:hypothetical protein